MLVTYAQAEVPLGLLVGKPDVRHWRYAELSFESVWLHVSIGYVRSGPPSQSTLLMPDLREFEQLLADCGDSLWIDEVMVVSPGDINGSGAWMMERLVTLEEVVNEDSGQLFYVYSVERGKRYIEGSSPRALKIRIKRTIYSRDTTLK